MMQCHACGGTGQLPDVPPLLSFLPDPEHGCVWVRCRACRGTFRGASQLEAERFAAEHEREELARVTFARA